MGKNYQSTDFLLASLTFWRIPTGTLRSAPSFWTRSSAGENKTRTPNFQLRIGWLEGTVEPHILSDISRKILCQRRWAACNGKWEGKRWEWSGMNACSVYLSSVCQDILVLFHSSFSINHVPRCSSSYAENKPLSTQVFSEFITSSTFPHAFWQVGWFVCQQSPGDAWLQGWSQPESFRHLCVDFVTLDQTPTENSGLRPSRRKRPQRSPKRSGRAHKAQKHAESQHLRSSFGFCEPK